MPGTSQHQRPPPPALAAAGAAVQSSQPIETGGQVYPSGLLLRQ